MRRNGQNQLRRRGEALVDFAPLPGGRIAAGEKEALVDDRLEVDERCNQGEEQGRNSEHPVVKASRNRAIQQGRELHLRGRLAAIACHQPSFLKARNVVWSV